MQEWVNKMTCSKCKKKGHLAFNCPPKYNNKIRKVSNKTKKYFSQNLEQINHENKSTEQAANVNEFAGYTYQDSLIKQRIPIISKETETIIENGTHPRVSYITN